MPINSTGLSAAAIALQVYNYAQLHSASAGTTYSDNLAVLARVPVVWNQPAAGNFGLQSALKFVSGEPGSAAHSVTLWDAISDGTCAGEFLFTDGDSAFNAQGEFLVTAIDFTVTATDAS